MNAAKLQIGIHGASGRMGRLVLEEIATAPDLAVAWTGGRDLPDNLAADVIIDFSTPAGLERLLLRTTAPVVSGTTGGPVPEVADRAFLHAANFSLGVAVLARLLGEAARALPDYDVEIVELHHRGKRDAPSGTALRLSSVLGRPEARGRTGERVPGEVGIHAVRGGDIVGEHRVYLCGPGERLELGHVATSRALFAAGAVKAARWIVGRKPGRYWIEDVLSG